MKKIEKKVAISNQDLHKSGAGFTVVEVLVVVGIISVIAVISLVSLVGWREQKELTITAQKIATTLREAQSRAMSQELGSSWGVQFSGQSYTLFYSDASGNIYPVNSFALPSSLNYDLSTLESNETVDVLFNQISGDLKTIKSSLRGTLPLSTNIAFSLDIKLLRAKNSAYSSSTVDLTPGGRIRYVVLSCVITCSQTSVTLPPPPPTLQLTANPSSVNVLGGSVISWSAAGAASCAASWTSSTAPSGSQSVYKLSQTTTYPMTCTGSGGEVTESVTVTVTFPRPVVTLTANPSSIQTGDPSTLSWSTTFANSCSATWTASTAPNGSQVVRPSRTTVYSITCTGQGGSTTANTTVKVTKKTLPGP